MGVVENVTLNNSHHTDITSVILDESVEFFHKNPSTHHLIIPTNT